MITVNGNSADEVWSRCRPANRRARACMSATASSSSPAMSAGSQAYRPYRSNSARPNASSMSFGSQAHILTSPAAAPTPPVIPPRDTRPALPPPAVSGLLSADAGDSEEDDPSVRRRTFVGLTGAALFGAVLADPIRSGPADAIESFAAVLAAYAPDTAGSTLDEPPDLPSLAAAVARAKRDYQACRYSEVTENLPALLGRLQAACAVLDGEARSQAYTLSAEAHHVAASILFKVGDQGLGWLAADRSMQAARAGEGPRMKALRARR